MKTKYTFSKVGLACASFVAFAGITAGVAARSAASDTPAVTPVSIAVPSNLSRGDDDGQSYRVIVPSAAPVTRSRGT